MSQEGAAGKRIGRGFFGRIEAKEDLAADWSPGQAEAGRFFSSVQCLAIGDRLEGCAI